MRGNAMNWNELLPILDKNFNTDRCMKHVYSICDTDRWFDYSKHEETAEYCADAMRNAGFSEVELLPMKADGKTVYCDWSLPKAWKAYHGKLRFAGGEEICDYHKKPCSLVMYTPSADNIEGEVIEVTDLNDLSDKYKGKNDCKGSAQGRIACSKGTSESCSEGTCKGNSQGCSTESNSETAREKQGESETSGEPEGCRSGWSGRDRQKHDCAGIRR